MRRLCIAANRANERLSIFTRRDVSPGEELCISYKGVPVSGSKSTGVMLMVQDDEGEYDHEPVIVQRKGKKGKAKLSKSSAAAHTSTRNKQADEKLWKNRCFW